MHLKTRVTLGVATAAAAIGAALVPATTAFAAPALTVTWANQPLGLNLQDGDSATVSGTGFPASTTVYVVECSTGDSNPANCDQTPGDGGVAVGQTDASGAFSVALVVRTETIGSATCGAASACFVGATTNPTAPDATNSALGNIQFDNLQVSPRSGLHAGDPVNLSGAGYDANKTVYVSECTSTDPTKALQKCDFNTIETYTTDAEGKFTGVYHKLHTGQVGSDGSKCSPGGGCIIAGTDNAVNPGAGHIGGALVKFAALKPTATTAHSTKSSVSKGEKFAIKGQVTAAGKGVNGLKVTLYKVTKSGLNKIASKTTATLKGKVGAFKFGGLTQKRTSKYQVKSAANAIYAASASKVVKVTT